MVPSATNAKSGIVARIISALILAPFAIGVTVVGGWAFATFVVIVAWLMTYEWDRLTGGEGLSLLALVQGIAVAVAIVAAYVGESSIGAVAIVAAAGLVLVLSLIQTRRPLWAVLGVVYVGIPSAALVMLREGGESGLGVVVWIFAVVWGTDIAAYVAGRSVGGPKLSRVSPNKTWAGLFGGVLAAAFLGGLVANTYAFGSTVAIALFGAGCALISQVGDLFESWVKRRFDVKDSGRVIPGHGGVLDRVDGLLPVVVTVALVAWLHPESNFVWR